MSGWPVSERILLLAVVILAALIGYRQISNGPAQNPAVLPTPVPEAILSFADTAIVRPAEAPPSPAGTELLARIRSSSEQDLEGIVDTISAVEALGIYRQLTVSDRKAVLSALPVPILARKAQELLGVPESHFRQASRPALLASSLVDAALGESGGLANPQRQDLSFTTAIDQEGNPQAPRSSFARDERKIYACLDGGPEPSGEPPGVLVRWSEQGSGTLVYLHYLPFDINRRWNYVYFEAAANWIPGDYRVSFYRTGASVSLFAEGAYAIEKGN